MSGLRIFAHRGLSGLYPENTLVSFRAALDAGLKAVELDVICTADSEFAVSHDAVLKTPGGEADLRRMSAADIQAIPLPEQMKGERIPFLKDVFELVPEGICINIELKLDRTEDHQRICEAFIRYLEPWRKRREDLLISSFHLHAIRCIQKHTDLRTAFLLDPDHPFVNIYFLLSGWRSDFIHISRHMNAGFWVGRKRFGGVNVYTVNDPEEAAFLAALGVKGIFSDRGDLMLEHFNEEAGHGSEGIQD